MKEIHDDVFFDLMDLSYRGLQMFSHAANRIPVAGGIKIALEAAIGHTIVVEKLPNASRKLYGFAGSLSALGYMTIYAAANAGHPELAVTGGIPMFISSICTAAGQMGTLAANTSAGDLLKAKFKEYISALEKKLAVFKKTHSNDTLVQEMESKLVEVKQELDKISPEELSKGAEQVNQSIQDSQ